MRIESLGQTVHLTVNQVQNHPAELFTSTTVERCSDTTIFYARAAVAVNNFPLPQRAESKTHCLEIRGSYDPNDKQAFPKGFTSQHIIAPNTRLDYLVRFQNTGNDTAIGVYVIDTLDTNLNPESLEMGAASHNYELSMQTVKSGKTFLRWQFNNIMLPDSNTNEPKSNGFIQYRISPKANLPLGTKVRNHAEIYFDFNPPIITNQTLTTYDNRIFKDSTLNSRVQILFTTQTAMTLDQLGVKLYPNPVTQNQLTASFSNPGKLVLYDAQGKVVFSKDKIEGTQTLPLELQSGFYTARIVTAKGSLVHKVLVW